MVILEIKSPLDDWIISRPVAFIKIVIFPEFGYISILQPDMR